MSILTRYILKEMIGPTALGFGFYTSIILMRSLFDMAGMIIRRSLSGGAVGELLLYSLPNIIVLTLPMSLLFGILIAIGRMSADSEIVAMRALGMSTRKIYRPVFFFSVVMFLLTLYLINFVMPQGNQKFVALGAELTAAAAERVVKPRVFYDEYENLMIFVNDVDQTNGQWKGVFVADSRHDDPGAALTPGQMADRTQPQDEDGFGSMTSPSGQRVIVASRGNITLEQGTKDIWMNLFDAETHLWDPSKSERYDHTDSATQRILLPSRGEQIDPRRLAKSFREMNLAQLVTQERQLSRSSTESDRVNRNIALVEIHKKFAIPFACITFGVLGLPLGITNRRGGKSSGFSLSILIIVVYYVMINNGEQLAVAGKIPPALGMWGANIILLTFGIYLLARANRDALAQQPVGGFFARLAATLRPKNNKEASRRPNAASVDEGRSPLYRFDITFPNILDRYILREFFKILVLVLVSVVALFIVVEYTELSRDVRQNDVSASTLLRYFRFQIFNVLNWTLPISVLVSTLVTFGILAKNNEITAIKSNGVSLYRIAAPILAVAVLISVLAYFILDFVLPYANQRASEIKRRIEGKTEISSTAQQKLWYRGKGRYLINFLAYDRNSRQLSQVQVFEFHPSEFRLTRRVYAERATWNGEAWAFEDGWMRSFPDEGNSTYTLITEPVALFYEETPDDFATESTHPDQMTYAQLRRYINTLKDAGYASDELAVRLYAKTSWPAISIVMALIAMPFAFRIGRRGALYGIGISLLLGIIYWLVFAVFTKFGEVGNLPPLLSAWSANILFALAAIYMFLHVET